MNGCDSGEYFLILIIRRKIDVYAYEVTVKYIKLRLIAIKFDLHFINLIRNVFCWVLVTRVEQNKKQLYFIIIFQGGNQREST